MASTSASLLPKSFKYDIFLSFRGEDTRKTFVDHLYHALQENDIRTFKDDERIEKREWIGNQRIRSIQDSRVHLILFSKNYASSLWCLDELVKIMECHKTAEHIAYPIFYDVSPSDIRYQRGAVGEAFAKHVDKESVGRWRDALKEASGLAGWELKTTVDGNEARLIQHILQDIRTFIDVDKYLVGIETRVKNVVSSLERGFNDVRIIGITGMKGSGKTALARAVFNHMSIRFEGKSFVKNVKKVSKGPGLKKLQNQILWDVLEDQSIVVTDVSNGKNMMKKMMRSRKVLVVLDDVDDIEQLEALAGEPNWFKAGSRIIITTRDEQLLVAHRVKFIHHVNLLSQEEAILLFYRHAFGGGIPVQGYEELSRKVVPYARGLPSKVNFLGSFLYGKTQREWADTIERLKAMSWKNTLELRFEGLEDQKEVFLDDGCISKGQDKYVAMRILEMYGFDYQLDSSIFKHKSSIMGSDTDHLCVHNHIVDVHGYINNPVHPYKLITKETKDTLVIKRGSQGSEDTDLRPAKRLKALKNMKELRFLYVDDGHTKWNTDEVSQYLPNTLQSLYWSNYPFRCLPRTFQANNLINLEMNGSNISQLWDRGDEKDLKNLKFLDLSNSKLKTFDLGIAPNLETLCLNKCLDFEELQMAFECPTLKFLNVTVSKLSRLDLGLIPNLEGLCLEECNDFVELHMPVKPLKLKFLEISGSKVSNLWLSPHLEKFECLEELTLSIKELKHLPNSICMLKHLKSLKLKSCLLLEKLPDDLDKLECLEELYLTDCTSLRDIPNCVCKMKCLRCLHLPHCVLVKNLPEELGHLEYLKELNIEGTHISHLPQSILQVKGLCIVWSKRRLESYGLSSLKEISRNTASGYVR